ncbi:hypothetical protein BCV70DRAFT_200542 [Testicularia cyperi]|uniref:Sin-like protein conserved region-domain-containing protein n=1 Tax=Testicularia cyperi TaxID=1882483 RepID=A0A317XP25_9BASI|nr:hypothetical protein BCV70DRAFT_200542 [Testicularia cyperi]
MASENLFLGSDDPMSDPALPSSEPDHTAAIESDAPPSLVPVAGSDLPPDSELVASLPVYLSNSLLDTSSLHVFQYPIYPRDRPLPVPYSAASRGHKVTSRWRPRTNHVEVDLPLDVREEVYNADRGSEFGAGADIIAQKQARADAAHGGSSGAGDNADIRAPGRSSRVKKEEEAQQQQQRGPKRLENVRLESSEIPNATSYMVGIIRDQALHLTELSSVVQLRPSMNYLDAIDEARETERRRDRAAQAGELDSDEDDDADDLIEMEAPAAGADGRSKSKKDVKKPVAQTLNVALRGDPNAKKPGGAGPIGPMTGSEARDNLMAAQREAEAEKWIDMEWRDEFSQARNDVYYAQMFAATKVPLDCKTKPREYLLEAQF